MYHLRSILEPLGIDAALPTAGQDKLETDDPWRNLFPVEKDTYRLDDMVDFVSRCPECFGEIEEGMCAPCAIVFSESESDGDERDWESENESMGGLLEGVMSDSNTDIEAIRVVRGQPASRRFFSRDSYERGLVPELADSPPELRAGNHGRPVQLDEEEYPDGDGSDFDGFSDDDYGGSFIDDGELSESGEGIDGVENGDEEGGVGSDELEVDMGVVLSGDERISGGDDDPPIEELRRRREQRYTGPDGST